MSGIVGILNLDGAPADKHLLQVLTNSLKPRGPDSQQVWLNGPIGFGHTLFKTTEESEHESQPFTLGTGTWITADARVDAQSELIGKLKIQGQHFTPHPTDAELILRAYEVWDESCVEHLLGDFAFGIWDTRRKRLFCARDHMGVRPFYYAQVGSLIVFSNALDCIRECPNVSDRLNDLAIADFLLFGHNQDSATTAFANIRRLPPAYCASWAAEGNQIRRYWTMPIDDPLLYKREDDYCNRFNELLSQAVGDRLRTSRVGVFMSGGLDSPSLAATARDLLQQRYSNFDLLAWTTIDDFKPEEGYYAGLVAKFLKIPIQYDKWDEKPIDPHWERTPYRTAEPCASGWYVIPNRISWQKVGAYARVFLWGEGPDNILLLEWRPYLSYLSRQHLYGRLLGAIGSTLISQRRLPYWGKISQELRRWGRTGEPEDSFPSWFDQDFESKWQLRTRWNETQESTPALTHPVRPRAYASLHLPLWQQLFEGEDAEERGTFLEMRHPYFDLRLMRFMLACPPLPWCRSKYLMRRAMRGRLPNSILKRKKSGIAADKVSKHVAGFGLEPFHPTGDILRYINPRQIADTPSDDPWAFHSNLRVRSLNHWLQYSLKALHNNSVEAAPYGTVSGPIAADKKAL